MDVLSLLEADVSVLEGVRRRDAAVLESAFGIRTVRDLLEHYPHQDRYRDIGAVMPLSEAPIGEPVTVVGTIESWRIDRPRSRRLTIPRARVRDDRGARVEAPFFNQDWLVRKHPAGTRVAISGTLERFRGKLQLKPSRLTATDDGEAFEGERVQAIYPATEALASHRIAGFVRAALDALGELPDHLPDRLRRKRNLIALDEALRAIHRPPRLDAVRPARDRLVYDELLCLQVGLQQRRHRLESEAAGLEHGPVPGGLAARFLASLPFTPTDAQLRARDEIGSDLRRPKPMHRLLQGDVGSGKTIVAAWAMLCALDHGRQAVLMAPTEVLAEQHHRTFAELLAPLGVNASGEGDRWRPPATTRASGPGGDLFGGPRVEVLTGSATAKRLRRVLAEVAVGDVQLLIGTHALLEERVTFHDLGVVIVDEQHRFGVEHRARLRDKRADDRAPDVLVMTATPIPRSLALTLYGDLDVTILDELPPGRQEITTQVIPSDSPRRDRLYDFVRERVARGERAYVVCPLVEESEALDLANAEEVYRRLSTEVFPDLDVALVHGRLPAAEKDAAMDAFRSGAAQILVATTVVEVGVDVPEATVMVIEDADRFGISQLHQLRGRVGRGSARSYCVLFSREAHEDNPRLEALAATSDGFALAETDLKLRGEGSLFDVRQSGLPDLRLAKLIRDHAWIVASREDARELVVADPDLSDHTALLAEVRRRYGDERLAALESG